MSTILSADDLNDFIAPGVACIKPVEIEKTRDSAEIAIGADGLPQEGGQSLQPAQISLQDCLACSGCITSSEAMLVELQSPKEMLSQLEAHKQDKVFVVSVCHQTRVSLAKAFGLSIASVDMKLNRLFVSELGFQCVFGTEIGRVLALEETWKEVSSQTKQPILSSICPGWTLYAEKTHPEVLPYLSTVKSPQQLTGRLVKSLISANQHVRPQDIYHVSLMPCFDKKLESSRPDFEFDGGGREVDLVITARELVDMMQNTLALPFEGLAELPFSSDAYPPNWPVEDQFKSNLGSSSGGYLDFVLRKAAMHAGDGTEIRHAVGKNRDYIDYSVVHNGQTVFRGAQVYGFRNIQNLVRKIKMNSKGAKVRSKKGSNIMELGYVELMACPGGCVNGGGQIGTTENVPAQVWTQEMDMLYSTIPQLDLSPGLVAQYGDNLEGENWLRADHKPIERDTSLPAALTVGTQW